MIAACSTVAAASWRRSNTPTRPDAALNTTERAFLAASRRARRVVRAAAAGGIAVLVGALAWLAAPRFREYQWRHQAATRAPMVEIRGGVAVLGGRGDDARRARGRFAVATFSLDRYEVRNGAYRLCVRAARCTRPLEPANARPFDSLPASLPVVNVSGVQAAEFCRWLGRRLLSDAEWERAARGLTGRPWPWGSERPSRQRVNVTSGRRPSSGPAAVDTPSLHGGATPEGVMQLVGNVREYTSTPDGCRTGPYKCTQLWDGRARIAAITTRGGGWDEPALAISGSDSLEADPVSYVTHATGFRCAKAA